jgi:hypothetical protein
MSTLKTNNVQVGQSVTATNNFTIYQPSSPDGTVRIGVGNSGATTADVLTANSSGNVGIGTSSPSYLLDVQRTASNGTGVLDVLRLRSTADNAGDGPRLLMTCGGSTTGGAGIGAGGVALNSANLLFYAGGNTERARITSSNFLVNTTSTFDVTAGAFTQVSGALAVFTSGSPNTLVSFYNGSQSARVGFIGSSGNSTQYNSGSDYRLKDNVTNINGALSKIASLRPVTFTWKISPEVGVVSGFIAHELDEVVPEAVTGEKDAMCSDGVTPDYQMVDQSKLVPLLVAAIKEQQAMIEELKAKVAGLEGAKG